jgi:predicted RNase H-like HicB family nuclease
MDREDIIKLAREAGFDPHDMSDDFTCNLEDIERFAALVIAEKEKQIIAANAPEIEKINAHIKTLEEALVIGREKMTAWMMAQGYATGHGDTIEDLLREAEWQIREHEREACALVCEERQEVFQKYYTKGLAAMCAEAIRARSKQ